MRLISLNEKSEFGDESLNDVTFVIFFPYLDIEILRKSLA